MDYSKRFTGFTARKSTGKSEFYETLLVLVTIGANNTKHYLKIQVNIVLSGAYTQSVVTFSS